MIKRLGDILLALTGIILAFPLMILIAIFIRIDSPGPVIFRQKRVGLGGQSFTIYKFRTMVEGAEKLGSQITAKADPRVTQIGRLLRWLKLDELPQFFNVLKGEMSFVGPRPEVPVIVERYSGEDRQVLDVPPGIIGPSQIENRDEEEKLPEGENVEEFYVKNILPAKLRNDLAYARNLDPFKDLKILFGGAVALVLSSVKLNYILESRRRFLFLVLDIAISVAVYFMAYVLRFENAIPPENIEIMRAMLPFVIILRAPCFIYFGLYQSLWQYLGTQELIAIIKAVTVGSLLIPFLPFILQLPVPPRAVLIIDWVLLILALGGSRIIFKLTTERLRHPWLSENRKNVLIIGAGDSGEMLIREFIKRPALGYRPVGFVDNDVQKIGVRIHGVKVIGQISQLSQIVKVKRVDEVIIALPEAPGAEIREIMTICRSLKLPCRIVPQISPLLSSQILPLKLRSVDISDLLGRELVTADLHGIQEFFRDKTVLVTGAGGSIGSELARIIFQAHPRELVLVESSESNLYDIEMDLAGRQSGTDVVGYLRDATHYLEMRKIFERHKPQIIYHAAAFKHVPLMELHFEQGVLNNVVGTRVMADLALQYEAECFTLISTDKAIRPRSLMGATKRLAELYAQSLNGKKTKFLAVRFGNVFNSRGSVVPLFKKQIEEGGPVTITDPNVTRYFMDVSESVFLILQASMIGSQSEIFVLDMGQPVKILDLARDLMQLMGVSEKQIPVKFVGLRPGEKLEEEIQHQAEQAVPTSYKKIRIWKSTEPPPRDMSRQIDELVMLIHQGADRDTVIQKIKSIVPEYMPWRLPA